MLLSINIYKAYKDPGEAQFCLNAANVSNSALSLFEAVRRQYPEEDALLLVRGREPLFYVL
jgi:hypothetical protein